MKLKVSLRLNQICILMKIYICKIISIFLKKVIKRPLWLIIERGDDARDNGFIFFEYIKVNHKEINVFYIIDKKSPDYDRVKNIGAAISYGSFKHLVLLNLASNIISTHIDTFIPISKKFIEKGLIKLQCRIVFLQHGIVKDYLPQLCYPNVNPKIFICGARPEYEYILNNFNHPSGVVHYTGLARFDKLHDFKTKNQILLMPTWRTFLNGIKDEEFCQSTYYKKYIEILKDKELGKILNKYDYELIFYPHYEIQKFIHLFNIKNDRVKIAGFKHYDVQTLLKESKLLITDYSSVYFDFAYMHKPTLYYQFDREDFFRKHYQKGYFDYDVMGFGKIIFKKEDIIKSIEDNIKNNFDMEQIYIDRIDKFFELHDNKNCERIYNLVKFTESE